MDGSSLRVVVADDCVAARVLQLALLDAVIGVQVVGVAPDGRQAIDTVHATRPDAVFLDIAMPVMDGLQAAAVIGSRQPEVRVILHSAFGPVAKNLAHGPGRAAGYFQKARTTAELLPQLRQVFPTHIWVTDPVLTTIPRARRGLTKSPGTARPVRSRNAEPAARYQQTSRPLMRKKTVLRCIDANDVRRQVKRTLLFVDPRGFDVPGIVADIIHTYGLVNLCDSVTFPDYSTIVMRHYRGR